ncbi:MAG: NBR1-Ig-like domain-containing protein, partial [Patescibacteria group bacterium]
MLNVAVLPASAATEPYQAQVSSGAVTLAPGQSKLITLKFKNSGSKTWTAGKSATAVYLYGKSSIFGHPTWLKDDQPAIIKEAKVAPGAMASASFYVKAPSTPGTYSERFLLSYASNAWIKGSVVTVTFTVANAAPVPVTPTPAPMSSASDVIPSSNEWKAELVDKGGIEWQIMPLDHSLVSVTFKNTGTKTWKREGAGYVSMYTWSPKYRQSAFKDSAWKSDTQAATLVEAEVKPGQIGTFRLELRAPEVPGKYQETFQLAAEDSAWLSGGSVTFPVAVGTPDSYIAKGTTSGATNTNGSYSTVLLLASHKIVTLSGNGRLQLTNGFKNAGTAVWNTRSLQLVDVTPALGNAALVRDESWPSSNEAVNASGATAPGEIGFITYTIKAPAKKGDYVARFKLVAEI